MRFYSFEEAVKDWMTIAPEYRTEAELQKRLAVVRIAHDRPYIAPSSFGVLIRKGGYFYRPDWCGYTASIHEAGRYAEDAARSHAANAEGVTVHQLAEFL